MPLCRLHVLSQRQAFDPNRSQVFHCLLNLLVGLSCKIWWNKQNFETWGAGHLWAHSNERRSVSSLRFLWAMSECTRFWKSERWARVRSDFWQFLRSRSSLSFTQNWSNFPLKSTNWNPKTLKKSKICLQYWIFFLKRNQILHFKQLFVLLIFHPGTKTFLIMKTCERILSDWVSALSFENLSGSLSALRFRHTEREREFAQFLVSTQMPWILCTIACSIVN